MTTHTVFALLARQPAQPHPDHSLLTLTERYVACVEETDPKSLKSLLDIKSADPAWLASELSRHHLKVMELHEQQTIFPMQFGMLITNIDQLAAVASEHNDLLDEYFELAEDCDEWALKLLVDPEPDVPKAPAKDGMSYLLGIRQRQVEKEQRRQRRATASSEALEPLASQSRATRELPVADNGALIGNREVLANHALLITRSLLEPFQTSVEQAKQSLGEIGIHLELTGPWPPYSFRPRLEQSEQSR